MIRFSNNAELATGFTGITDEYLNTEDGPYSFTDIQRLTFQINLPDSTVIQKISSRGIEIYLRSKRVSPFVVKEAPPKPAPEKPKADSLSQSPSTINTEKSKILSQEVGPTPQEYSAKTTAGLGLGLDYGGIGMKLTLGATSGVSMFGALGYNFHKVGYNVGLELNFTPKGKTTGFLSAMYGYNAVLIQPAGSFTSSETFYGPSFGLGVKSRNKYSEDFFSFQIIYPIRDAEFMNAPMAEKPWPVLFSVGYHFGK